MRTAATALLAGVIGVAAGAGGWALLGPEKTVHDGDRPTAVVAAATATAPVRAAGPAHYDSAQKIADRLTAAGFTVSKLRKETEDTLISEQGGTVYDLTISPKAGAAAPADSGINMFASHKDLVSWTGLSKGFGGVAVTGDTWAVSLPSDTGQIAQSTSMAPRIATALGGVVAE